jgi:hypothetical protein
VLDQGFQADASPPQAGEQREVRPSVEGQSSAAPTPSPPHRVAGLLVQSAMLGGRDLAGKALDQRGEDDHMATHRLLAESLDCVKSFQEDYPDLPWGSDT